MRAFAEAGMKVVANIKPCLLDDHPRYGEVAAAGGFMLGGDDHAPLKSQFWTGCVYAAGRSATIPAPLDRLPLLALAAAIVATTGSGDDYSRLHDEPSRALQVFPGASEGASTAALFEDDGISLVGDFDPRDDRAKLDRETHQRRGRGERELPSAILRDACDLARGRDADRGLGRGGGNCIEACADMRSSVPWALWSPRAAPVARAKWIGHRSRRSGSAASRAQKTPDRRAPVAELGGPRRKSGRCRNGRKS